MLDTLSKMNILRDYTLITDHHLPHNRPDIIFVIKDQKEVFLIDVAIPSDSRLSQKFVKKQDKHFDLKIEVSPF